MQWVTLVCPSDRSGRFWIHLGSARSSGPEGCQRGLQVQQGQLPVPGLDQFDLIHRRDYWLWILHRKELELEQLVGMVVVVV